MDNETLITRHGCVTMTVMMIWAVWTGVYVLGHRATLAVARVFLLYFRRIMWKATA